MSVIDSIQLSGTVYTIEDSNANKTVSLTQAQYDALSTIDPNTYYVITDASGGDLSQYMTSAQTMSAINEATSGKADSNSVYTKSETSGATEISTALGNKQDTLSAGTNITIEGNVISATGGGSVTVDSALDSTSENPVQNKVIYQAIGDIETLLASI